MSEDRIQELEQIIEQQKARAEKAEAEVQPTEYNSGGSIRCSLKGKTWKPMMKLLD